MGKTKADLTLQQQRTRAKIILTGIKSRGILLLVVLAGLTLLFGKKVDMYVVKVEKDPLWECTYVPIVIDCYFS